VGGFARLDVSIQHTDCPASSIVMHL